MATAAHQSYSKQGRLEADPSHLDSASLETAATVTGHPTCSASYGRCPAET